MRALLPVVVVAVLGCALSGCVVADVASAGGSVVRGTADVIAGSSDDEDKDTDHHRHKDGDDDGDK